jgi:hypothetical protein
MEEPLLDTPSPIFPRALSGGGLEETSAEATLKTFLKEEI